VYDPAIDKESEITPYFLRAQAGYYLEVDMKTESGSFKYNAGEVQIGQQRKWVDGKTYKQHQRDLKQGYNFFSLDVMNSDGKKANSKAVNHLGNSFFNKYLNWYYRSHKPAYALIKCNTKCSYKLTLKTPYHFQYIKENTVKQSILVPTGRGDKYSFWSDGKQDNYRIRIHLKNTNFSDSEQIETNPDIVKEDGKKFFKLTQKIVGKMFKLNFRPTGNNNKSHLQPKPILINSKNSHLNEDTLQIHLGKLPAGAFNLSIAPVKNFFVKYYITFSGGDSETLLPGNYVVGRVMSNFQWHRHHPKTSYHSTHNWNRA
jgi:hypothetical protein